MSRINQAEYIAAYRIFNHTDKVNGGYYGQIQFNRIYDLVSQNKWVIVPHYGIKTINDAKELPMPNVYMAFESGIISDNKNGCAECSMGLTYHNSEAMLAVRDKLSRNKSSALLIESIQTLDDSWEVAIQHKIKTHSQNSVPYYESHEVFKPSAVSRALLSESIRQSDICILKQGDIYPKTGTEVIWAITILNIYKETEVETFDACVSRIFEVFRRL